MIEKKDNDMENKDFQTILNPEYQQIQKSLET